MPRHRRSRDPEARGETKMEMTPMIDVTFLLLIFFLCTVRFRILEGKIPSFLPKDVGVFVGAALPLEKIEISVHRSRSLADCITEARREGRPHPERSWVWDESQIEVRVGGRRMRGLEDLHETIRAVTQPYRHGGRLAEDCPKGTLFLGSGTLYIDCVKVINELLRADFHQITFAGAREL